MAANFLPTSDIPATFLTKLECPKPRGIHPLKHPWKLRNEKRWNSPAEGFLDESCKRSKPVFVLVFPS